MSEALSGQESSLLTPASKIFVAGHRGLAGAAIVRRLEKSGCHNLILASRTDLDLRDQAAVSRFFARHLPEFVFLAAAKSGGILANASRPAEFLYENLMMEANVIHAAWQHGASKLVFLGSASAYPRMATQPITEEQLLSGTLDASGEAFAVAKIAGSKMAEAYRSQYGFAAVTLMPANLYGPGDNFDLETSQVLPAMIRRFHEAKIWKSPAVTLWGTGMALREFLHVDDLASAACFVMEKSGGADLLNVGSGEELSIAALAEKVARVVGYAGQIRFDRSRPEGAPRKLLDCTRIHALGWRARISLEEGIASTYEWYSSNAATTVAG